MEIGTIQTMIVNEVKDNEYVLIKGMMKKVLPHKEATKPLNEGENVEVFILKDKATMHIPILTVGTYVWVTVTKAENDIVFVDIGTTEPVIVPERDLPQFRAVWPVEGDRLYVTLKVKHNGELFAVPAKERQFSHLIHFAENIDLNDLITGTVIRTAREGTVILTAEGYRGFIHHTEREYEPRLGQHISGRVIELKEDGTLNVSLKPLKHERIDDDAEVIIQYLQQCGGEMDYNDRSDPEQIRKAFNMSKSAFKRALGRLMKIRAIEQRDGKTFLIDKK